MCAGSTALAQSPPASTFIAISPNTNVLRGIDDPAVGDKLLQRQNEPAIAVSTRNPNHIMMAANDYRAVDIADDVGVGETLSRLAYNVKHAAERVLARLIGRREFEAEDETIEKIEASSGEAWIGLYLSNDGGRSYSSFFMPGFPADPTAVGQATPAYGRQAASDPVLAAAPAGRFYLGAMVFDRHPITKKPTFSQIVVSQLTDRNNSETGQNFHFDSMTVVDTGTTDGRSFLDKPAIAADINRQSTDPAACGPVYIAWTVFDERVRDPLDRSKILVARSTDCGARFSGAVRISHRSILNQGVALAVRPSDGAVFAAYRSFGDNKVYITYSENGGGSFRTPQAISGPQPLVTFDQPSLDASDGYSFRTNALPTIAIDGAGNVFVAWQERLVANGNPRIVITKSADGTVWTPKRPVEATRCVVTTGGSTACSEAGAQVMPSLSFSRGRLMLVFYEARPGEDDVKRVESRNAWYITGLDTQLSVRVAQLDAGGVGPSTLVSHYATDSTGQIPLITSYGGKDYRHVNRPNLPMYAAGSVPFMGDYIALAPSLPFVPASLPVPTASAAALAAPSAPSTSKKAGPFWRWATDETDGSTPTFVTAWGDNRDVIFPRDPATNTLRIDGPWPTYGPPGFGPCINPGSRNANVYSAFVTPRLVAGTPTSFKDLGIQRAFPLFVQNQTSDHKFYRLSIVDSAPAVDATFRQIGADQNTRDIEVFGFSTVTTNVFAKGQSGAASQTFRVDIAEITAVGGSLVLGGDAASVVFNGDQSNPPLPTTNATDEIHSPRIFNPRDPSQATPQIDNPQIDNPQIDNPQIDNLGLSNPQIDNPEIPNLQLTNVAPTDGSKQVITNVTNYTWQVANVGNTASSFAPVFNIANQAAVQGKHVRLFIYKTYRTPTFTTNANGECIVNEMPRDQVISVIDNPQIDNPQIDNPQIDNPQIDNATFFVAPSDVAAVGTVRRSNGTTATAAPTPGDQYPLPVVDAPTMITLQITDGTTPNIGLPPTHPDGTPAPANPPLTLDDFSGGGSALAVTATSNDVVNGVVQAIPQAVTTGPDLVVSAPTASVPPNAIVPANTLVTFSSFTVENTGQQASNGPFKYGFYLSATAQIDPLTAVELGSAIYPSSILPGVGNRVTLAGGTFAIPAATAPGAYFIGVRINSGNASANPPEPVIFEPENNDSGTIPIVVAPGANLVVLAPTLTPATLLAGQTTSATVIVANTGTIPAAGSTTAFFLSTDAVLSGNDTLLGSVTTPPLAAGATATVQAPLVIPSVPANTYTVIFQADVTDSVPESSAADNLSTAGLTVVQNSQTTLSFQQQPSAVLEGHAIVPAVQVKVVDNQSAPRVGALVQMTLVPISGAGALAGTTSATTDALGIATFSNLKVTLAGSYQLSASAPTLGSNNAVSSASFGVTPNHTPAATGDAYNVLQGATLSVTAPGVLVNDTDADGDALTAVLVSGVAHGQLTLNSNGSFDYVPTASYAGSDSFTYQASDGVTPSTPATVSLTVIATTNNAPVFTKGADQIVLEDAGAQTLPGWATGIGPGSPNESGQILNFIVSNDNNALFSVPPAIAANGTLSYTPGPDQNGSAIVTVQLHDDGGTANGGADTSAPQTFTITVTPVNDAPSFAKGPNQSAASSAGAQSVPNWAANISPGPPDESGQAVNFIVSNDNNALFSTQPAIAADGTLTYTPAANASGTATVTVQLHDNGGTANGGVDTSAAQTFTIAVTGANSPPGADPQSVTTLEDAATPIVLTGSDIDNDPLTFSIVAGPSNGTLTGTPPDVTYTPAANYNGADSFTFSTSDGAGTDAISGLVSRWPFDGDTSDVADGNSASATNGVSFVTGRLNQGVSLASGGFIDVSDAANLQLQTFTLAAWVKAQGPNTTADAFGDNIIAKWTLNGGGAGSTSLGWRASDGRFVFVVNNSVPTLTSTQGFAAGTFHHVAATYDGATARLFVDGVSQGQAALATTILYDAQKWVIGSSAFRGVGFDRTWQGVLDDVRIYSRALAASEVSTLASNGGSSSIALVSITLTPVNDAPSFVSGTSPSALEDAAAQSLPNWATAISAGANESGQALNFIVSNDNNGLFSAQPGVAADGTLTFTPVANASGSATVTVQLHDDGGTANGGADTSAQQIFTITVIAVNDAPSFTKGADQITGSTAGPQTVPNWATNLSAGPPDESGQVLNFIVSNDNNGVFSVQPAIATDGTLTYTPAPNTSGTATVSVQLHDNGGAANGGADTSIVQTFTIMVSPPPTITFGVSNPPPPVSGPYTRDVIIPFTVTDAVAVASMTPQPAYVVDSDGHRVIRVDPASGSVVDVYVGGSRFSPIAAAISPVNGKLYFSEENQQRILRIDQTGLNAELVFDAVAAGASSNLPTGVAFASNGDLFFIHTGASPNYGVWRIAGGTPGTAPVQLFTLPAIQGNGQGIGLTFAPSGDLFIVDQSSNQVMKSSPPYSAASPFIPASSLQPCTETGDVNGVQLPFCILGIAVSAGGDVFVAHLETHSILRFDSTGASLGTFTTFGPSDVPAFMQFDAAGQLWVTTFQDGQPPSALWRVAPDGTATIMVTAPLVGALGVALPPTTGSTVFGTLAFMASSAGGLVSATNLDGSAASATSPAVTIDKSIVSTLVVSNADDSGEGSLRQAIVNANAHGGIDTISFDIQPGGAHTIAPIATLPNVTDPAVLDATTQPGWAVGAPAIELSGVNAGLGGANGLRITAGGTTVRGFVLNRWSQSAIELNTLGNDTVAGNFIGTTAAGTASTGANGAGITVTSPNNLIGGTTAADRNVISGNPLSAIQLNAESAATTAAGTRVEGNYIGTDKTGTAAIGNGSAAGFPGVQLNVPNLTIGGLAAGAGNLISGNLGPGISAFPFFLDNVQVTEGSDATVQGNRIGTDASGTQRLPNAGGVQLSAPRAHIGGSTAAAQNIISGNNANGIQILSAGANAVIEGNIIGLDPSAAVKVANSANGIAVNATGTTIGPNNIIAGNNVNGVVVQTTGSATIVGNVIGTNGAGASTLGNLTDGVRFNTSSNNIVGAVGAGNIIAFNGGRGVNVTGVSTAVRGNSIHSNTNIGIDLGNNGVTQNDVGDGDSGANNLQNFPVVSAATISGSSVTIDGSLNSTAGTTFALDFFASLSCDPTGFGEGAIFLGTSQQTTDGAGNVSFSLPFAFPPGAGTVITATATSSAGNTSEFGSCVTATGTGTPVITLVSPSSGQQGATLDVALTGQFTNWVNGTTTTSFGVVGVTVNSATVTDPTHLTANITIGSNTTPGLRTITVTTGTEVVTLTNGFNVAAGTPAIANVSPNSAAQGTSSLNVALTGQFTSWVDGTTTASFGDNGVTVNSTTVTDSTHVTANVTIAAGATLGARTVTATTGAQVASLVNGFTVLSGAPAITQVSPNSAQEGATNLDVAVTGQFTSWSNGVTTASFGGNGVTVNSTTVADATHLTANLTIAVGATLGARTVTVTTGAEVLTLVGGFTVNPGTPAITQVNPNSGQQGTANLNVALTGQFTNWVNGTTTASFGGNGVTVNSTTVSDATHLTANVTIAAGATVGARTVTAATGSEVAALGSGFTVTAAALITQVTPNNAQQGQTLDVVVTGQGTHFATGVTAADFGAGILVNNVTAASQTSAAVNLTIDPTATLGFRTVTMTTGAEIVALGSAFNVTAGSAVLTQVNPNIGTQGQTNFAVAVTGSATHFAQNATTASFGSGITVHSVTVTDATHATAQISIDAFTAPGARTVTVTTVGESASLANGFTVQAGTPILTLVNPTTGQLGATNLDVAVTGQFSNFAPGSTTADFGAGITINSVTVADATHATVSININPTTTLGQRTVTLTTGAESAQSSGSFGNSFFTVVAGPATLTQLNPNNARQGETRDIAITGSATHFAQSSSVASFGGGIVVNQLTVHGPTSATANIAVQGSASQGLRTVTVTTGGEQAFIVDGFNVQPGLPVVTNVNPVTGHQAETFNVSVAGQFTNWEQGTTTASFGPGITINSVTVNTTTFATVNISIDQAAATGSRNVTMTTGTEVATQVGAFTVLAGVPQLTSITPNAGGQGASFTVFISALFTNFTQGVTTVDLGSGITTGSVTVNGPGNLSVPISIALGTPLGLRPVTVTTGSEIVTRAAFFNVNAGQPALTIIDPNIGTPSQTLNVNVTGQFTNWQNGVTVASFGPDVSVGGAAQGAAGPVTVTSATTLTASLTIGAGAPLGPRNVTVTTGSEVETVVNGFTVQSSTPTAPSVVSISPAGGAANVPLNALVTTQFSQPMDRTTFDPNTPNNRSMALYDTVTGQFINGTMTVDASGLVASFVPSQLLAVNRTYSIYWCYNRCPKDQSGNNLSAFAISFTTGFNTSSSGPTLVAASINDQDTSIPLNARVVLQFSLPIDPQSRPAGIRIQTGGVDVPGTFTYNQVPTIATFQAAGGFSANTTYDVVLTSSLKDAAGNSLVNPQTITFTTGTTNDVAGPLTPILTPTSNASDVGRLPLIRATFTERVNRISVTNVQGQFYIYPAATGQIIASNTVTVAPDALSATLNLSAPLLPSTQYCVLIYSYTDLAGNFGNSASTCFTTGAGVDTTPPTVTAVNPTNAATGVAVNSPIQLQFSEVIDPATSSAANLALTPAVAGTLVLAGDGRSATFTPSAPLTSSTTYGLQVNGFADLSGNALTSFSSGFSTRASSTNDTTRPTVTQVSPANGATNVALNSSLVFTIDEPLNPLSVSYLGQSGNGSFSLFANMPNIGSLVVPASISLVNGAATSTVTITPSTPLPAGVSFTFYACYNFCPSDFAGNLLNGFSGSFTTTAGSDTTGPHVVSITPLDGTTGVGRNQTVTVVFSEPLNPNTVNNNTFTFFNGASRLNPGISRSADNKAVYMSTTLPEGAHITVAITSGVTDLLGNPLADFTSAFDTAPVASTNRPSVITQRPIGSGIATNAVVTLIADKPMDPTTIGGALHVSQNGVLITGAIGLSGGNQIITFTPDAAFAAGALVQVFLDSSALDTAGNALNAHSGQFTIVPSLVGVAAQVNSLSPTHGSTNVPVNSPVDIEFTKALDPATVNSTNIFLKQNDSVSIPATVTLRTPKIVRITPNADLPTTGNCQSNGANCPYYRINITTNVKDPEGVSYGGPTQSFYFYVGPNADNVVPTVTAVEPFNGTTNVGNNAVIRVQFSKAVNPLTIDAATVHVSGGPYTLMPASISADAGNRNFSVTPNVPLPNNTVMTVAIDGVQDLAGNPVTPLTTQFTTGPGADTVSPRVIYSSVDNGNGVNVPVNSVFTVVFSEPMDTRFLNGTNFYLYDFNVGYIPTTASFNPDGLSATLVANSALAVGRTHQLGVFNGQDLAGNLMINFAVNFTTAFAGDSTPPTVVDTNPPDTFVNTPLNSLVQVFFSEPVQAGTLGSVRLLAPGAIAVPTTQSMSAGNQTLTLTPAALLAPTTQYTISISGAKDTSGNAMAGPVTKTFTTGPGVDLVPPSITLFSPPSGTTNVGTNVVPRVTFNERIIAQIVTPLSFYIYNGNTGVPVAHTVAVAGDRLSATLTPQAELQTFTTYCVVFTSLQDLAGNVGGGASTCFATGAGPDTSGPTVASISPSDGAVNVAVNVPIVARLSQVIDPYSVGPTAITLSPAVAGTITSTSTTVTLTPSAALAPSTVYTVTVSGLTDLNGNPMATFNSTFTTGASTTPDVTKPSVTSFVPANGVTGVPVNTSITININEPINPATVSFNTGNDSFNVFASVSGIGTLYVPGTWSVTNGASSSTVVFTPSSPLPGATTIIVSACYNVCPTDFAGNTLTGTSSTFTTANTTDAAAPTVESITPADGATNIGRNSIVTITFAEPLNPNTLNTNNFAVFSGSSRIGVGVSRSADNKIIYLSTTWPPASTLTVDVTTGVTDLAGNPLATDYISTFTTAPDVPGIHPSVITQRPAGSSVSATAPVYLIMDRAMNGSSLGNGLHITQNGAIVAGATQVVGDGRTILFTPTDPFLSGALVQIFLDGNATDTNGNSANPYSGSFTVAPDVSTVAPQVAQLSPIHGSTNVAVNAAVYIQFTKDMDAATINSGNIFLKQNDVTVIPAAVTLVQPRVARLIPTSNLPTSGNCQPNGSNCPYYRINIASSVLDTGGLPYAGPQNSFYFYVGTAVETVAPIVTGVAPFDTAAGAGTNASIRVTFSEDVNQISITPSTIAVSGGAFTLVPTSIVFDTNRSVIITPQSPLPVNTLMTIAISGVLDTTGNAVTPLTTHFTTGSGPDTLAPTVIASSVDNFNSTNVPTNTVFTVFFSEPMDTRNLVQNNFYLYDYNPGSYVQTVVRSYAADGLSATISPTVPLPTGHTMQFGAFNAQDLAGNVMSGFAVNFTVAATDDTTPPQVMFTNPGIGISVPVPINAQIQVKFNEPVQAISLAGITLKLGGVVQPATLSLSAGDTVVTLTPNALMSPTTTYTLEIAAVKDVAGNTQTGTTSVTFTTRSGADLVQASVSSVTPVPGATNVNVNVTPQIVFNDPMNPISFLNLGVGLRVTNTGVNVPVTFTFSADYKTVTMTPVNQPLSGATQYTIFYNGGNFTDTAGNTVSNPNVVNFTTQ